MCESVAVGSSGEEGRDFCGRFWGWGGGVLAGWDGVGGECDPFSRSAGGDGTS